ncbi:MAG TPA: ABC transporter permease [Candidatus Eremiobacteraceae bacterium]|nr:ABC transporter permease [Candidatus Eremiobacteraceae bacterium]
MRGLFLLDHVLRDLRYALRGIRKDLRFTFVAVFALALGIAASTVVFSIFYNLMLNAIAARDAQRLVVPVVQNAETPEFTNGLWISWADVKYLSEHNQVFENIVGSHSGIARVQYGTRSYQFENGHVSPDAFEFYGVPPLLGRGMVAGDGKPDAPHVFVMSFPTWKGQFGADPGIIGKSFAIEGDPATLVGVMPERFHGFGATQEIWTPVGEAQAASEAEQRIHVNVLARVKRGITFAAASAELDLLTHRLAALQPGNDDYPKKFTVRVVAANDFLMGPSGVAAVFNTKIDLKSILYNLLAAVLVLLLIACGNVTNLLLVRATVREKELAVRSALGASRWQLMRPLLLESLVLALGACATGCLLARIAMKAVDAAIHQKAWQRMSGEAVIGLNVPVLCFAAGITLLATLICGLAPALRSTRRDPQPQLLGSGTCGDGRFRHAKLRAMLVVGQVALSIVLLIGAGLMIRSLYRLTHVELGFNAKNILVAGFAPSRSGAQQADRALIVTPEGRARFQRALQKIREVPGVASVAVNNTFPGYGPSQGPRVGVPGATGDVQAGLDECDENCLTTLEMRLLSGRWLSHGEVQTRQFSAVINETLARALFGDTNPVGRQLDVRGFKQRYRYSSADLPDNAVFEIVGVVRDTKNAGPQSPVAPMAFIPPMITGDFLVQIRTKVAPGSLMHAVQEAVWSVDRGQVFWVFGPLSDLFDQHTYVLPEFGVSLSAPLAGIALLLVVIGVFSVMAYTVSLQTQEIGVRLALGAQPRHILRMVLRRGIVLIAAGIGIGLTASCALTRFLASQVWGVSATDPCAFGAVVVLVAAVGSAACFLPARRATRLDPLVALRYE